MQIDYKNIVIDVKEGTPVSELLGDEIQKAKCKVIGFDRFEQQRWNENIQKRACIYNK